jgi:hypothetical protein
MSTVYCDVNVYNDVERGLISADEVQAFRAARSRGDITVLLSIPNIEEALGVWHSEPATARKRLQIVRDLAGFGSLLKQPSDLFADVIRAYAASGPEPSPLLARQQRLHFASVLDKIADGGGATYSGLITRILADVKALKEAFKASMSEGRAQSLTELTAQGYTRQDLRTMSFEGYFTRGAEEWAAGLADGIGRAPRGESGDSTGCSRSARFVSGSGWQCPSCTPRSATIAPLTSETATTCGTPSSHRRLTCS